MDTSYTLAQNIVKVKYEDLPPDVVDVTKKSILDTIGVTLAASTLGEPSVKQIIELVTDAGGRPESTIFGFGGKVPASMAAFANGSMTHQLDYDDTYEAGRSHPGAAVLPAACAIAERIGSISGKEFITAVALGCDVNCRLSLPLKRSAFEYNWMHPTMFGKFGAVTTAGKLLGLDETQMVNAFGLVLHQANVSMEGVYTHGSALRAMRDGFTGMAGVLSAQLAQNGIPGDRNSLDGKYGFYNICCGGDSDPAMVTADLGKRFDGVNVSFKKWPCCRCSHGFIEAALLIVKEHDIKPKDVAEITAIGGAVFQDIFTGDERAAPSCSIDAKLSLPFILGVAVSRGNVILEDFTSSGLSNPVAVELARKVKYHVDQKFVRAEIEATVVEIKIRSGQKYSKQVPFVCGHPQNPIAREDLLAKFRDCARYSITPLSPERIDTIIDTVDKLEQVKDISQLIQLLA